MRRGNDNDIVSIRNTESNDVEIIWFLLKEFQFVMSSKNLRIMAYTVCHAPVAVTP